MRPAAATWTSESIASNNERAVRASGPPFRRLRPALVTPLVGDEATGANIVKVALDAPLRQIAVNAGLEGGVVVEKVRNLETNHGLNAATGDYVDLLKAGIIDPAKVTRSALQNAASIAKNILTTEVIVAEIPDKDGGGPGGMPDMSGMM